MPLNGLAQCLGLDRTPPGVTEAQLGQDAR